MTTWKSIRHWLDALRDTLLPAPPPAVVPIPVRPARPAVRPAPRRGTR